MNFEELPMSESKGSTNTNVTATVAVALVLLAAVALPSLKLREQLRDQVLLREGQSLQAIVSMQYAIETSEMEALGLDAKDVEDFATILQTARLPGVVGVRVIEKDGGEQDVFPSELKETKIAPEDWSKLAALVTVVRLHREYPLADLTWAEGAVGTAELLEIIVPLPEQEGSEKAAQFWIAGTGIAGELARQDRGLFALAAIVWLSATGIALLIMSIASRRLRTANAELRRRGEDLSRANKELALAAKVSAVGVVAAHLIHGLKNPVQGIRGLALDRSREDGDGRAAWMEAAAMAGRLQAMVSDVTSLLTDEASGVQFRVTAEEMMEIVSNRTDDVQKATDVELNWQCDKGLEFDNRLAALVSLIIANLVTNSCEASEPGSIVHVSVRRKNREVEVAVSDRGTGIPVDQRQRLFLPSTSTKPHGSGIGLAVSRNLAQHVQATLELEETGPAGTVFVLRIPVPDEVNQA